MTETAPVYISNCTVTSQDSKGLAAIELAKAISSIAEAAKTLANKLDMSGNTIGINITTLPGTSHVDENAPPRG